MRVAIVGAGGHAKVVCEAAISAGLEVVGFVDELGSTPRTLLGLPVACAVSDLECIEAFVVGIGDNAQRRERFDHFLGSGLEALSIVHSAAIVAPGVDIGRGSVVFAGAVINIDTSIGENAIINTGACVDHDCVIGAHAHIAPACALAGAVSVGEGAFLGIGTCVTPGVSIGDWAVCGAGAAVVSRVDSRTVVAGVPARFLKGVGQ